MKVYEIIVETLRLVGRDDVADEIADYNENGGILIRETERINKLVTACFNAVCSELGRNYFPLEATQVLRGGTTFAYADFEHTPVRIIGAADADTGESLQYVAGDGCVEILRPAGKVRFDYTYSAWTERGAGDDFSFARPEVDCRTVEYGMAAEYLLVIGDVNAAAVWERKYYDRIEALCGGRVKTPRVFRGVTPARRWI